MILEAIARFEGAWGLEEVDFSYFPSRAKLDTVKVSKDGQLVAVLKVGRSAERVRRLHDTLTAVWRATEGTRIRSTTPEPLLLSTAGEGKFVAESAVGGRSGERAVRGLGGRGKARRLLEMAVDWLVAFEEAFSSEGGAGDGPGPGGEDGGGLAGVEFDRGEWHRGPMHGDFVASNILMGGDGIRVIDWDEFRADGSPVVDLLYCLVDVAAKFSPEPFRYTFYRQNWYSDLARESVDRYCDHTGLSRSAFLDHLPLYLRVSRRAATAYGTEAWRRELDELIAGYRREKLAWR